MPSGRHGFSGSATAPPRLRGRGRRGARGSSPSPLLYASLGQGFRSRSSLSGARVCSLPSSSLTTAAYAWLVCWSRCFSRSVLFGRQEARDARHLGRYVPERPLRAHRRFWQWHVQGSFCWFYASPCAPFCCWQAQMLGIMAGMIQKQLIIKVVIILVVAQRLSHMVQAVFADH